MEIAIIIDEVGGGLMEIYVNGGKCYYVHALELNFLGKCMFFEYLKALQSCDILRNQQLLCNIKWKLLS